MTRILSDVKRLKDQFKELDSNLSDFEAYKLALDLQRNELFQEAYLVRVSEKTNFAPFIPNAMERVVQELTETNEYLNKIRVSLNDKLK